MRVSKTGAAVSTCMWPGWCSAPPAAGTAALGHYTPTPSSIFTSCLDFFQTFWFQEEEEAEFARLLRVKTIWLIALTTLLQLPTPFPHFLPSHFNTLDHIQKAHSPMLYYSCHSLAKVHLQLFLCAFILFENSALEIIRITLWDDFRMYNLAELNTRYCNFPRRTALSIFTFSIFVELYQYTY